MDNNSGNQAALQSSLSSSIRHWDFLSLSLFLSSPKTLNISQDRVFQASPKLFFSIQRFLEGDQKDFKIRRTLEVSQSQ